VSFKTCGHCGREWPDREAFLADPDLRVTGYQVVFRDLATGLVLFNHACQSTLAVPVGVFADLHGGPRHDRFMGDTDQCPHHCLDLNDLGPCPTQCQCAFFRAVLQAVKNYPKGRR
jgi:hypothetical protein